MRKNSYVPREKSLWAIFFEIEIFILNTFYTILIRFWSKNSTKNLCLCLFSTYDPHCWKQWLSQEKFITVNFFEIKIFLSKWVLDHSKSILIEKNNFNQKFFVCVIFRLMTFIFQKKWLSPEKSHNGIFFRNWDFNFEIRFKPFWIDSDQKNIDQQFVSLPFFGPKWPKLEFFENLDRKNFGKILYALLEHFIAVLLSRHTYLYL